MFGSVTFQFTDGHRLVQLAARERRDDAWRAPEEMHGRGDVHAQAAVRRGVALFVEKPWAATVEQAERLAALCGDSRAPVMTAFSFRFHQN